MSQTRFSSSWSRDFCSSAVLEFWKSGSSALGEGRLSARVDLIWDERGFRRQSGDVICKPIPDW